MSYRRAARVDDNHREIRDAYRAVGAIVADTSGAGSGFPDMVVSFCGEVYLVEVKDGEKPPSATKLTKDQIKFHAAQLSVGVVVHVAYSVEDALEIIGIRRVK